jgi:hypothetical protein
MDGLYVQVYVNNAPVSAWVGSGRVSEWVYECGWVDELMNMCM